MPYQVLVVEDSALMRSELTKIIEKDFELKVVGTARNGKVALEKIKELSPDVVTMDINMPVMDGIEALKWIIKDNPIPVVMISALTSEGASETIECLKLGAFDFIHKPAGSRSMNMEQQENEIRFKVKQAARGRRKLRLNQYQNTPVTTQKRNDNFVPANTNQIVGIGVSTGGPKTLFSMLPGIPADFPGAILVAQHMPEKFTQSFASRLNETCHLQVKEAEHGETIQTGHIYVAPGGRHMKVVRQKDTLKVKILAEHTLDSSYVPSVEAMFSSLNEVAGKHWIGVMLTGMGNDGAKALSRLFQMGGHTIAQSEETSTVFGMPKKVIEMGGAEFILDDSDISAKIVELLEN